MTKAMLYLKGGNDPVAIFDEVKIITMNDNHTKAPQRITYKSSNLNAGKTMLELIRDQKMTVKLDDGRYCDVLLQHASLDMDGNSVGVLRVLGDLTQ